MFALADASDILIKLAVKGGVLLVVGVVCFLWVFCKTKRVLSSFNRAIEAEDTAAFDALVRKHRKTLCDKEGGIFDVVFDYLLVNNSLSCMKVIFTYASAQEWQRVYLAQSPESEGPLWETINCGSVDMLRLLLQQGMKAEAERVSPWLWAVSCGLVDEARILDEFGADTITPVQQLADKSLEEELMDEDSWQHDRERFIATIEYLTARRYPIPQAALARAEEWRECEVKGDVHSDPSGE